jgi:hypothetical protein
VRWRVLSIFLQLDTLPAGTVNFGALTLPMFPGFAFSAVQVAEHIDTIKLRTDGGAETTFSAYSSRSGIRDTFTRSSEEYLRSVAATPLRGRGPFGEEIYGELRDGVRIRFIATERPRWLLRAASRSCPAATRLTHCSCGKCCPK